MKPREMLPISVEPTDDFEFIAEMRKAMDLENGVDHDVVHPGWRERLREYFGTRQARGDAQIFAARAETGERVGMAIVTLADHYRGHVFGTPYASVHGVFVMPHYRRRGAASALVSAAEDWAKQHGMYLLRLRSTEMGKPLYQSLGFTPTAEFEKKLR